MVMRGLATLAFSMVGLGGHAGTDFGSASEAEAMAVAMIELVDAEGIDAAIAAMHNSAYPYAESPLGVNLFSGSVVVADNREPEMVAADYATIEDLFGNAVYPTIMAAEARGEAAQLKWYHYDTQEIYVFDCHVRSASQVNAHVMVCR